MHFLISNLYQGSDKSLARPGRKQAQKHVRDTRDFNNIETLAVINFIFPLQGKAPKEIHAILTETLVYFLPGRAKDLSASLYILRTFIFIVVQVCAKFPDGNATEGSTFYNIRGSVCVHEVTQSYPTLI